MILVASLAGFGPVGAMAVYAATQAYGLSLGLALSAELRGRGVAVTTLCPGPVVTEFHGLASSGRIARPRRGASSRTVAERALRANERGRRLAFGRWTWRLATVALRLVPRGLEASFTTATMKR